MERARETLTRASHKLAEQMYKSAQAQTPPSGGAGAGQSTGGNGEAKKDEGVIDAEYEDVDKK
jgi:molecular chaperone DnaK